MNETQKTLLERFYDETGVDMAYEMENDRPEDIDEFMERAEELAREIEVIYYGRAMEYLSEHDPSLQNSIELAHDMGYDLKNINSELLATLLSQQNALEAIAEFRDEIEEAFYND